MIPVYKESLHRGKKASIHPLRQISDGSSEQEKSRKNPSGRSEHVNVQQRCKSLDKKLKEIKVTNDLESLNPKKLCLVPDLVIPPKFKMPKFEKYDGTKCLENHLVE